MANTNLTVGAGPSGVHKTLSSTTEDTVTITGANEGYRIEVFNRATSNAIYARCDATTAVAAADGTVYIPAGTSISYRVGPGVTIVRVVGNGDAYSVHAITQSAW